MKKVLLCLLCIIALSGCDNKSSNNIISELSNKIEKSKAYTYNGIMEIQNDEEVFEYNIDVSFKKDSNYIVRMTNKSNNHEQIILKNKEGLYVITPSLNKSYKFESTWPDNSSQAYILSSIIKDIKDDKNATVDTNDEYYIIKSTVNYPNNKELTYQKVYIDKEYNINKIEVYSDADIVKITVVINNIDLKSNIDDDEFELNKYIKNECNSEDCKTEKTFSKLDNPIYPLYMPSNTYLTSSEHVDSETESRIILTFSGDKNFVIVEENAAMNEEHEIIPVYGEPVMLSDTIGALSTNSMYWTSNDIDYYMISNDLTIAEMVFIATSLTNSKTTIAEK